MPNVIYLPESNRWSSLGKGIGDLAGALYNRWETSDALEKSAGMDPAEQMQYLQQRLGEKGAKLVENMLKVQQFKTDQEKAKAEITNLGKRSDQLDLVNKMTAYQASVQEQDHALEIQERAAKIRASNAAASGSSAHAALAQEQLRNIQDERARNKPILDAVGLMTQRLVGGMLADQTGAGQSSTTPRTQPQSFAPGGPGFGTSSDQASASPIGETSTGAPARTLMSDSPPPKPGTVAWLQQVEDTGRVPGEKPVGPVQLSPAQQAQILGAFNPKNPLAFIEKKGEIEEAATRPTRIFTKEIPRSGGMTADYGVYNKPDGSQEERMIPGSIAPSKTSKLNISEVNQITGATTLKSTIDALKNIDSMIANGKEGDPLGSRGVRQLNAGLMALGFDPVPGITPDTNLTTARNQLVQHNLMGILGYLKGGGQRGKYLVDAMSSLVPKDTDSPNIRFQKTNAMELALKLNLATTFDTLLSENKPIPKALRDAIKSYGIDGVDTEDLQKQYFKAAGLAGIPVAVDPSTGDPLPVFKGGKAPVAGGGGRQSGLDKALTPPAKSSLPPGWSVEVRP